MKINNLCKLFFTIFIFAATNIFATEVYAGDARVESFNANMYSVAAYGRSLSVLIADNGDVFYTAEGVYVYGLGSQYHTGCIDREGKALWSDVTYFYYTLIGVTPDNRFIVKKSTGATVVIDRYGNESYFGGSYPSDGADGNYEYKIVYENTGSYVDSDDHTVYYYDIYLNYTDTDNGAEWKKRLNLYGLPSSCNSDSMYMSDCIVSTANRKCYIYSYTSSAIMGGTARFMQIDENGTKQWEISFYVSGGWYLGGTALCKVHKNGQVQLVTAGGVYHIYPPAPDLYVTPVNTVIGDNTKASFNYSVVNTYGTETTLEVYVNNKLDRSEALGKTTVNGSISLDLGSVDGFIDVLIKLLSSGEVTDSKTITVDKYNLLNSLDNYVVINPNTFFIINGENRVFDNNAENQAIINDMKNKGMNIYIIHNSLKSPLTSLLEE